MKSGLVVWLGFLFLYLPGKPQESTFTFFSGNPHDSLQLMTALDSARELYYQHKYELTLQVTENLLRRSGEINFHRGMAEAYFLKARCLNRLGNKDQAIKLFQQSFTIFEGLNEKERLSSVCNNWAIVLKTQGRFAEAIQVGETGLQYLDQKSNTRLKYSLLNTLGNIHLQLAKYKKALSFYYQSLEILNTTDSITRNKEEAKVFINLGIIYCDQKLFDKSFELFHKAEEVFLRHSMKPLLATVYINLGVLQTEKNEFTEAIKYLKEALSIHNEFNDYQGIALCLTNLGNVYSKQNLLEKAISHHQKSIELLELHNADAYLSSSYKNLGDTFKDASLLIEAERVLLKGLKVALTSGQEFDELQIYESLIDLYKRKNDLTKALMYYDLYSALGIELNDQEIGRLIGQKELESHIDKRDKQLLALQNETSLLQFQIDRKNIFLLLALSLLASISILFVFIHQHNRLRARNRTIELQQKLLRSQLDPHFIFNALGAIQKYIYNKSPGEASRYLAKFARLMRSILENSRNENPTLKQEMLAIEDYLDLQSLRFHGNLKYKIEVDPNINLESTLVPSMLVQPLVENAVKHGLEPRGGNGKIKVRISRNSQYMSITVEDDGIGLSNTDQMHQVKDNGKGLGNAITRERLVLINISRKQKLRFNLENLVSRHLNKSGTKAKLDIPLNVLNCANTYGNHR